MWMWIRGLGKIPKDKASIDSNFHDQHKLHLQLKGLQHFDIRKVFHFDILILL